MYRIVIADDEEYVRELLAQNINRSQTEFEVIAKAEDGKEAVRLVEELQPDILITDICMPFVSGLELIRQIQEKNQEMKTVIISGYDDFSYVKQALTLGVSDYLLKPFMPEELYEVLNKIKVELERRRTLLNNIQEMKSQLEDTRQVLREQVVRKLIQGTENREELRREAHKEQIVLDHRFCAAGIFQIYSNMKSQEPVIKDFLAMINETYFQKNCRVYVTSIGRQRLVLLFLGDYRNAASFRSAVEQGMKAMEESMKRYYDLNASCLIGGIYDDWKEIPKSYENALALFRGILGKINPVVFFDDEFRPRDEEGSHRQHRPKELEEQLLLSIQMGREEKAEDILLDILHYYESMNVELRDFVSVSLVELVFDISGTLMKAKGQGEVWEDENVVAYLKEHFTSGSLRDAQEVILGYVRKCCRQFASVNESQGERIVFQVKELIEKNIGQEDLSLEAVSGKLFFSHNYVRQIFKQVTGESFMEYLIRRRMEIAGELLKNETLKIQDIAAKTGYSNQRYFASCFKKYYGCTPTEYRMRQT